ncbi:hypothetical protein ACFWWT_40495 [Streptomyces sp. NPDC058676]|uniref:hypothetical protein n=1 Tax=unclassified Streptomyces TaxID=2593676 RepID=UPI00365F8067
MAVHRVPHESDGFLACSRRHGEAAIGSGQTAGEPVDVICEVVVPLLRRADLLSQLLRIGCLRDPREQEV